MITYRDMIKESEGVNEERLMIEYDNEEKILLYRMKTVLQENN